MTSTTDDHIYSDILALESARDEIHEKFRAMGATWMTEKQAKTALARLTSGAAPSLPDALETAFNHYTTIIDITDLYPGAPGEIEKDRTDYRHLLKKDSKGIIIFEDDECARFMSEKHNLDLNLCAVYVCSRQA